MQSGFFLEINSTDPGAVCNYQAPNVCTNETPVPCCERLGALKHAMNVFLVLAVVCLTTLFSM